MLKLQKEMIDAISAAVSVAGSQMEFERRSGIRQSTINKILNGKSHSIADRTWRDLLPFLDPVWRGDENSVLSSALPKSLSGHEFWLERFRRGIMDEVLLSSLDDATKISVLKIIREYNAPPAKR